MWPYLNEKRRSEANPDADSPRRRPLRFAALVADLGDLTEFSENDVAVKFWVPEAVAEALDELRERERQPMSQLVRQYLIVHCYGIYGIRVMLEAEPLLFRDRCGSVPVNGVLN